MTTKDFKLDQHTIHELIRASETRHGFKLNIEDFDFLAATIVNFVQQAVDKFIAGALEHFDDGGNFVANVDHNKEITNEIIDLLMYHAANMTKRKL